MKTEKIKKKKEIIYLNSNELQDFIVKGHHVINSEIPSNFHEKINKEISRIYDEEFNPGNNILAKIPSLEKILNESRVVGTLESILGKNYLLHSHKHSHLGKGFFFFPFS